MSLPSGLCLVTGATGHQGGAVADNLLRNGWSVRALTRKTSGEAVDALRDRGAEIVNGDLEDRASLDKALEGVYGVFLVTTFRESGITGEVRMGKTAADAAKSAGVGHFIFSSVGAADKNTLIPHFESKREIELYIRSIGLPATIYRPVQFMINYQMPQNRDWIINGIFRGQVPERKKIQLIALEDLAAFVNIALENPEEYIGREIELASDELTGAEISHAFARHLGRSVRFEQIPLEDIRKQSEDLYKMANWAQENSFTADIGELKKIYPNLTTFDQWLGRHGWTRRKAA